MFHSLRGLLVPAVLAGALGTAQPAPAQVRDPAGFFSKGAVAQAEEGIRDFRRKHGVTLLVETFKTAPEGKRDEATSADKKVKDRFFERWAEQRFEENKVNGVYVLLTREPGHVQVAVGEETRRKAFPNESKLKLRDIVVSNFKQKQYDEGLKESVAYVQTTLDKNLPAPAKKATAPAPVPPGPKSAPPSARESSEAGGFSWFGGGLLGLFCIGLVVVLGIWAVIGLIRAFTGAGRSYGGAPGGAPGYGGGGFGGGGFGGGGFGGGGGGGFLSGLMGGLFGAAAGSWMYDRFFRGDSTGTYTGGLGSPAAYGSGTTPEVAPPHDTYAAESAGGDFDAPAAEPPDMGGGDWGGGDSGGGDF